MDQHCVIVGETHSFYAPKAVLAGPHEWKIGGHIFSTVLVRMPGDSKGVASVIDVRSGMRVMRVECKAPRARPTEALRIIRGQMARLVEMKGEQAVAEKIRAATPIPPRVLAGGRVTWYAKTDASTVIASGATMAECLGRAGGVPYYLTTIPPPRSPPADPDAPVPQPRRGAGDAL